MYSSVLYNTVLCRDPLKPGPPVTALREHGRNVNCSLSLYTLHCILSCTVYCTTYCVHCTLTVYRAYCTVHTAKCEVWEVQECVRSSLDWWTLHRWGRTGRESKPQIAKLSTVNFQLSTVNFQLSTDNYQLSTVNCQITVGKHRIHCTVEKHMRNRRAGSQHN